GQTYFAERRPSEQAWSSAARGLPGPNDAPFGEVITLRRRVPNAPGIVSRKWIPRQETSPRHRQSRDNEGLPLANTGSIDPVREAREELREGGHAFELRRGALQDLEPDPTVSPSS